MPGSAAVAAPVGRILSLRRLPSFAELPARELAVIAEQTRERFFPRGSVLLRDGEPVPALYLLLDGRVHVTRRGRLLGHAGAGAAVGGIGLLARDPEGVGAVAEADTVALELDAEDCLEIFDDHFPILHHVLRESGRGLIEAWLRQPGEVELRLPDVAFEAAGRDLDLVERIALLRQGAAFAGSSLNALAELSRGLAEVQLDPGVELWREGETAGGMFLLVEGSAACTGSSGLSLTAGPGTYLGAVESVAERPRWYTAVTAGPVHALHGSAEILLDIFEDNSDMAVDFLAAIARLHLRALERVPDSLQLFFGCQEAHDCPD